MPLLLSTSTSVAQAGLRILLIVVAGYMAIRFIKIGIRHLEAILIKAGEPTEVVAGATKQRVATLTGMLRTIAVALIWAVVIVIALEQTGLNIAPILAGAGIVGLAVGFGAQNLVRDLISGFFLVLEDQVRVGDVAIINGTGGLVETLSFRTITLRDLAGAVHVFPSGTITTLSNMTMEWSAFVIDMSVAYKEDTDRAVEVMRRVAEDLRQDPNFADKILEPMEVFGVNNFADSAVVIQGRIKTRPIEQWTVGREYRRRLKKAFEAEKIEIPFPQRSLTLGEASEPFPVRILGTAETSRA
jgi:small conductance mechanosensitive channel